MRNGRPSPPHLFEGGRGNWNKLHPDSRSEVYAVAKAGVEDRFRASGHGESVCRTVQQQCHLAHLLLGWDLLLAF